MFSDNLKAMRKAKGYTQEELAIKLNVVRQTVSKWEKGLSVPDADILSKIADELDTKVSVLLGGTFAEETEKDAVAEQLAKISEQLAIKNRRSKAIWKIIGITIIAILLFNIFIIAFGVVAHTGFSGSGSTAVDETIVTEKTQDAIYENDATKEAIANGPYGSIKLAIPDTWEYEICDVDDEKLMASSYGIHLNPTLESKGCIEVGYTDSFGVCGTGLETKDITVANCEAHIGYYDGNSNWEFISWPETEKLKNITVLCSADWGEAYLDELLEILSTIEFDRENQTGGIGIYQPSSELGIDEGYLYVSAKHVSNTGATLVFDYSIDRAEEMDTQDELVFGSYLPIAKKEGDEWVNLKFKSEDTPSYEDIAYIIKENEVTTFEYDWERLYGSLEPGEYQIAININPEALIYAYFILR